MEIRLEGSGELVRLSPSEVVMFRKLAGLPIEEIRYSEEFRAFLIERNAEFAGASQADASYGDSKLLILLRPVRRGIATCSCDQEQHFQ